MEGSPLCNGVNRTTEAERLARKRRCSSGDCEVDVVRSSQEGGVVRDSQERSGVKGSPEGGMVRDNKERGGVKDSPEGGVVRDSQERGGVKDSPEGGVVRKRRDYLQWEDYFMAVAFLSAQRSKDPNSQVGACIVNPEHKIVGIGYNGMPNGCSDDELPWQREAESRLDTKYPYVCHAELNAILNKNSADVKGCTMYVALFPCNECAKLVIQSGIAEVVFVSDKYHNKPEMVASRRLLDMAGVRYRQHVPQQKVITIDLSSIDKAVYDVRPPSNHSILMEDNQLHDSQN